MKSGSESGHSATTVSESSQATLKHLNMKMPGTRARKQLDSQNASESSNRNNPQVLRNLSLSDLLMLAKQQERELSDVESKIYYATEHRYIGTIKFVFFVFPKEILPQFLD